MPQKKINVAVIGATGYVGLDLVYLLSKHPNVNISNLCAQKNVGKKIQVFDKRIKKKLPKINKIKNIDWSNINLVFLSLPDGESQKDVLIRSRKFLNKTLPKDKNCLIITHLVVLRMIIFHYLILDFFILYKIRIKHLEGFDILNFNGFQSVEIENQTRKDIRKQLSIIND